VEHVQETVQTFSFFNLEGGEILSQTHVKSIHKGTKVMAKHIILPVLPIKSSQTPVSIHKGTRVMSTWRYPQSGRLSSTIYNPDNEDLQIFSNIHKCFPIRRFPLVDGEFYARKHNSYNGLCESVWQSPIPLREDGGSKVLRNSGIVPQRYMTSQPRRPRLHS